VFDSAVYINFITISKSIISLVSVCRGYFIPRSIIVNTLLRSSVLQLLITPEGFPYLSEYFHPDEGDTFR
jgi:hypothetical protein